MSLLDCLQPRAVTVTNARKVVLGSNDESYEKGYKRLTPEQKREYHRLKVARYRAMGKIK